MSISCFFMNVVILAVIGVLFTETHARSRDGWGPWTDWSVCSTTCGQGLVYSQRRCHRLGSTCPGKSKRFKICKIKECPTEPFSPTFEECKRQNKIYYGGKRFYWEPYINPRTPCELSCKARGHHYIYNIKRLASDGTDCTIKYKGVCLAGKCTRVGCDDILESDAKIDKCGVCDGNGNSCRLISDIYTKNSAKYGYNKVIILPTGARQINISEVARSRNFLAVKSGDKYFINGHRRLHRTGVYIIAGATFIYNRRQGNGCPGECLTADGPVNQPVEIQILYYHKNPGIRYQYALNRDRLDRFQETENVNPELTMVTNVHEGGAPILKAERTAYNTIPEEGIPLSKPYIPGGVPLSKPLQSGPLISKSADNRLIISNRVGPQQIFKNSYNGHYPRYIPNREDAKESLSGHTVSSNSIGDQEGLPFEKKHYIHTNKYDKQAVRSIYGSRLLNNSKVSNTLQSNGLSNTVRNTAYKYDTLDDKNGLYTWSIAGFTECSEPCGGGLQETKVVCLKGKSQVVVTDDNCAMRLKPEPQTVICNTSPCSADWFVGNWSSCSTTCDKGTQSRLVECRRRISPSLILSVTADLCFDIPKPQRTRPCELHPCIRWKLGNWTKCSAECGHGQRTREVTCINGDGLKTDEKNCSQPRPDEAEICDMGSCVQGWYHTRWTKKCSTDCGRGYYTRDIFCAADNGNQIEDKQCSMGEKPSTRKSCKNKKPCGGFWFVGPWDECNATCGNGVKTRGVVCMRQLRPNVYTPIKENKCLQEKPPSERPCSELPPCKPKWYMTAWGECSKSCGSGIRRREVKCLNSKLEADLTCDKKRRPSKRQTCNKDSCETLNINLQRDSGVAECKDKYAQWCGFVKQARICEYQYYKELCCKSCTLKS